VARFHRRGASETEAPGHDQVREVVAANGGDDVLARYHGALGAYYVPTSVEANSSMIAGRSRASGGRSTSRSVVIGAGGHATGPRAATRAD
jgi:hypothetical protein